MQQIGGKRCTKISFIKCDGKSQLGDLEVDGRIIKIYLKCNMRKDTALIWFRIQSSGRIFGT